MNRATLIDISRDRRDKCRTPSGGNKKRKRFQ